MEEGFVGSRTKAAIWIEQFSVNSIGHVFLSHACVSSLALGKHLNSRCMTLKVNVEELYERLFVFSKKTSCFLKIKFREIMVRFREKVIFLTLHMNFAVNFSHCFFLLVLCFLGTDR